ncbi:MAG: phenylalanine--tRNA ligase subunit alpha [Actinomycetota bacterium]
MSETATELELLRERARTEIAAASSLDELERIDTAYLGRKARLNEINRGIKDLSDAEKRVVGKLGNEVKRELEAAMSDRRAVLEASAEDDLLRTDRLDLTMPGRKPSRGAPNPLREVARRIEDAFIGIGYRIAEGPEVETDWHNFEALNTPPDHPARSLMDTYYIDGPNGPETALLRTHTSPVQVRVMESAQPPIYVICPGRVFRREDVGATSGAVFHQCEGLAIDEGLTFRHLRGTIEVFAEAAFGPGAKARLVPSFYPFTEPSAELQVTCPVCHGDGCNHCASGWIGAGGCGMVDPNVLTFAGIDPERYSGFAFGMGIERIAMARFGVSDLRQFLSGDLRFLEQFRGLPVR